MKQRFSPFLLIDAQFVDRLSDAQCAAKHVFQFRGDRRRALRSLLFVEGGRATDAQRGGMGGLSAIKDYSKIFCVSGFLFLKCSCSAVPDWRA